MSITYLLDKALEAQKAKREKQRVEVLEKTKEAISDLAKFIDFKEAYLFGSVITPYRFWAKSDVDLGFFSLRDEDFFRAAAFLSRKIGRDVDLVQLERHRLREKITKKGLLCKRPD